MVTLVLEVWILLFNHMIVGVIVELMSVLAGLHVLTNMVSTVIFNMNNYGYISSRITIII